MIVTCQFDPLRDEGDAYAAALAAAGVPVRHLQCEGQTHTSLGMVGALVTGAYARTEMADALKQFFGVSVHA
jgi:acetyl esterase/lipase